jgi:two-component system chemotaxis response regulator CheY
MTTKKTILIVDDSVSLRAVARLTLERAGYRVLEAGDGLGALAELEKTPKVHLVISDVNMPNMDGIALVHELKKHPRHKFLPVIMLTTENQAAKKDQGRAAGAKAWVLKPFNAAQLTEAVAKLILP